MAKRRKNGADLGPVLLWGGVGVVGLAAYAAIRLSQKKPEAAPVPARGDPAVPPTTGPDTAPLVSQSGTSLVVKYVSEPLALDSNTPLTACSVWTVRWVADRGEWGQWDGPVSFGDQNNQVGDRVVAARAMVKYLASLGVTNAAPGFWYALGYRPTDVYLDEMVYHVTTGRFADPLHVDTGIYHDGHVSEYIPRKDDAPYETLIG